MQQQKQWRFCQKCDVLFFNGFQRRGVCAAGGPHDAAGFHFLLPYRDTETATAQEAWRYCVKCQAMFYDGFENKGNCAGGGQHEAAGYNFVLPHDVPGTSTAQDAWRHCGKCHSMFFDGYPAKGVCAGGGGHEAAGFNFVLPHDVPGGPDTQQDWRFCQKCESLFFDGGASKGICPAGGAHDAAGYNFVLPRMPDEAPDAQQNWRFCRKCEAMFYDGYPNKGVCPAGGGHVAAGFNFAIPHDVPETPTAQRAWRFCRKCEAVFFDGFPEKGRCAAGGGHEAAGYDFVLPHSAPTKVFSGQISSGGLAALGGWAEVTIQQDGSMRWRGHAHDSGLDGYDFGITAILRSSAGKIVALVHTGHVGGTLTAGSRDHDWDLALPPHPVLAADYSDFEQGRLEVETRYSSDFGSTALSALSVLGKWVVGATPVGAAAGFVIFAGVETASLISTGSLVPGARVVDGVLWLAGPSNTLLALAADGIASAGSRTRELTDEEYRWACTEVFGESLPPKDRIVLTDTLGGQHRAFTFLRFDGKITLNMGPEAFQDPRQFHVEGGKRRGETFIHELVHAWQIAHTPMDLALLADALASKVCEAQGSANADDPNSPYHYDSAGPEFGSFNLEQQAEIISDWFAGRPRSGQTGIPKDENSPYYRYVVNNIRAGQY